MEGEAVGRQEAEKTVQRLVEGLFRRESGRLVSSLTRVFGIDRLELAEDVVQETLLKALGQWPYRGIPENPAAWLARVARNQAINILRGEKLRRRRAQENGQALLREPAQEVPPPFSDEEIRNDQLRMMFVCCIRSCGGRHRRRSC